MTKVEYIFLFEMNVPQYPECPYARFGCLSINEWSHGIPIVGCGHPGCGNGNTCTYLHGSMSKGEVTCPFDIRKELGK